MSKATLVRYVSKVPLHESPEMTYHELQWWHLDSSGDPKLLEMPQLWSTSYREVKSRGRCSSEREVCFIQQSWMELEISRPFWHHRWRHILRSMSWWFLYLALFQNFLIMLPFLIEMSQTHNSHLTKNLLHVDAESEIMESNLVYQNRKDGFSI